MRKILRVNVSEGTVKTEGMPAEWKLMGGRFLTSSIIAAEVDAQADPLGPDNKIVFATGLLAGTTAPNSSRMSVGTKSPLTGGIKEANVGGQASQKLARLGIGAIIAEGDPGDKRYILKVNSEGATLEDAGDLWGKLNYETADALRAKYGEKVATIQVGPAGENGMRNSSVAVTDPEGHPARHAGRGGVGAVMGKRGLKAIVVDDAGAPRPELADEKRFKTARKTLVDGLKEHPVTGQGLPAYGTAILVNIINEAGGLPTKNFHFGRYEDAEMISGEELADRAKKRGGRPEHACMTGCVVHCSNVYNDEDGNYVSSGVEYETIWAFGANCMNNDLDAIAHMDRWCDDLGLDTIDMGDTMAVAMDAGKIPWGDTGKMLAVFEDIKNNTEFGQAMGNGTQHAGELWNVAHIPTVKGQGIPAYDPRAVKGIGATYATSTMGADHTAGYAVATNILNVGGEVDPLSKTGQCVLSQGLQEATAAFFDSTGLCVFLAFACLDQPDSLAAIPEMVSAMYGEEIDIAGMVQQGKDVLELERKFNRGAGFTKEDDRLPKFFSEEKLPPHNTVWDVASDELDQVCGWSPVLDPRVSGESKDAEV